jgi:hypothetical protein
MKLDDYVTLKEAAQALGYTDTSSLRQKCLDKRIPEAKKLGRDWIIPKYWVQEAVISNPFAQTRPKQSER